MHDFPNTMDMTVQAQAPKKRNPASSTHKQPEAAPAAKSAGMIFAAEIREGDDVRKIIRRRKEDLQLSDALLERYSGLCEGHCSKILPANPRKAIGWDVLPLLLGGVGLKILIIEDLDATRRLLSRSDYAPRRVEYIQPRKQVAA